MAAVALSDLLIKIRKLTARPSPNQITDATIVNYLNLFYEHDFPQVLKTFDHKVTYSFVTQPNIDKYYLYGDPTVGPWILGAAVRNLYKSFEPPVYIAGYSASYYQSFEQFNRLWPNLTTSQTYATSTGIAGPYVAILSSVPVLRESVVFSVVGPAGTTLVAQDTNGVLTGDVAAGSTINYITGACTITWNVAIPVGNVITVRFCVYQPSRPLSLLYYADIFTLRPVPDDAYKIEIQAFVKPFAANPVTDALSPYTVAAVTFNPYLDEYFQLLAYGVACKIFVDSMEMENYAAIRPLLQEQFAQVERRTIMQIKTQRSQTIYSENMFWSANKLPTQ